MHKSCSGKDTYVRRVGNGVCPCDLWGSQPRSMEAQRRADVDMETVKSKMELMGKPNVARDREKIEMEKITVIWRKITMTSGCCDDDDTNHAV